MMCLVSVVVYSMLTYKALSPCLQFDPLGRAAAHHSYNPQWVDDIDAAVTLTARGKDQKMILT